MSELKSHEKRLFERLFGMRSGYVLDFTNSSFAAFFREHNVDIDSDYGSGSKANRLRAFWEGEPSERVADVLDGLLSYWKSSNPNTGDEELRVAGECARVIERLNTLSRHPSVETVQAIAKVFDAAYMDQQIGRMWKSVDSDPELAIGTAKELIETCCYTILAERGKPVQGKPEIPALTKATLKELKLVPEDVPDAAKGRETIKRLLSNLGTVVQGLAELRGLYGSGHGKEGRTRSLKPRHAKLAVGAAATLATFLFETHKER
jgi:Abortive infection C-terminus